MSRALLAWPKSRVERALGLSAAMVFFVALAVCLGPGAIDCFAASGNTLPHGGFSVTDSCLQCHDVHDGEGDYVLMRGSTVTAVCATCHTIYQQAPTGAYVPGYRPSYAGTAASMQAYRVPYVQAMTHEGHRLGLGGGTYTFCDGVDGDGSYIPRGTGTLTAVALDGVRTTYGTTGVLDFAATDGLYCASCHAVHGTQGKMMATSFSTKLLSRRPNHVATDAVTSWGGTDGWCWKCHDNLASAPSHSPGMNCAGGACHPKRTDWPHTGAENLH